MKIPASAARRVFHVGDRAPAIKTIEARLKKLGYDVGKVDGKYTGTTFQAVKSFKADEREIKNDFGSIGAKGQRVLLERIAALDKGGAGGGNGGPGKGGTGKDANVRATAFNWPERYRKGGDAGDEKLFDQLAAKSDVMGLSEFKWGDRITDNEKGWGFFHPNPKNDGEKDKVGQLLAWRKDKFDMVKTGTSLMNRPTRVQQQAAGPTMHSGKSIVWAKLRHKETGELWTVAVAHFVPSKHLGGATEALWKKQRDEVGDWMAKQGPRTIVMGDFNGEWDDAISKPLRKVAQNQSAPSHAGKRKIDWILRSKDLDGVGPGKALNAGGQSDHRPVQGVVRG